ncbi:aspartyl/asparaginyl beta-hydroxylase domain-containing protein [Streptosporangium algeriense]|uniref:Aspartyl/asparaginyl beta-hydroxylase domain-containing protein n=1 Tax=Streptosporangium algeriense TaxID=1682748 RepID=A0ABW3DMJ2_9ACTN
MPYGPGRADRRPRRRTSGGLFDEGRFTGELPARCVATRELITRMAPHISGEVVLRRMAPESSLPPHYDDNDYQQTVHLGLTVPPGCGIRVDGRSRTWEEGKALAFSPVFLHEVWNHGERPRDVLLIDVWHMDLTGPEIEALTWASGRHSRLTKQGATGETGAPSSAASSPAPNCRGSARRSTGCRSPAGR